jgi:hypothetical protein
MKMQTNGAASSTTQTTAIDQPPVSTLSLSSNTSEIEEKKRKMTLPLLSTVDQNQNNIDYDSTKRLKATQQITFTPHNLFTIDTPLLIPFTLSTPDINKLIGEIITPINTNVQSGSDMNTDALNRLNQALDAINKRDAISGLQTGLGLPDSTYATLTNVTSNSHLDKKPNSFIHASQSFSNNNASTEQQLLKPDDKSTSKSTAQADSIIKDELLHTVPIHKNQLAVQKIRNSRKSSNSSTSSPTRSMASYKSYKTSSPDNMDDSDLSKVDAIAKKRERNREAARKCRTRKLEKIATLEKQVKELNDRNQYVTHETNVLRDEINALREKLMQHKRVHGCEIVYNF